MSIYAYLRVSTNKQDYNNQYKGIIDYCKNKGLKIDKIIVDDGISGVKEPENRKLGNLLKELKENDILICSELSRLGRKLFMIMKILEYCMNNNIKVITIKENYELCDNIQSKILAFAFGLTAEIERKLISDRTKEALNKLKDKGKKLGRPIGSKNLKLKLEKNENKLLKLKNKKLSQKDISKILNVSARTLHNYIKKREKII